MRHSASALALVMFALSGAAAAQDHPNRPEAADHAAAAEEAPAPAGSSDDAEDAPEPEIRLVAETTEVLPGMGDGGFAITTSVPEAQAFFSNGMELHAAFAHYATVAAMEEAVRRDPACAMCKWGQALVTGPTVNFGIDEDKRAELLPIAREAAKLARRSGTAREKALTAALVERFKSGDTGARDRNYAAAMKRVQQQFPDDHAIAWLTADAMMVGAFTRYDDDPDAAMAGLEETIPLLEGVLAEAPDYTPAIHFYIHATEILGDPDKAEPYADKLARLAPNASHLVHMPAHTWYWVGRYREAGETNRAAVDVGKSNAIRLGMTEHEAWNLPYHSHNVIYGLGGALMAGDSATALDLARPLIERAAESKEAPAFSQLLMSSGYFAMARFDPSSVAALPEPEPPYLKAAWRYARGEAAAWSGDAAAVRAEMEAIPAQIAEDPSTVEPQAAEQMLGILRGVLAGRAAMLDKDYAAAAAAYRAAAEIEESDSFNDFTDPPAFWYPVRRDEAAALLAAGDASGAKAAAERSLHLRMKDPVAEDILAGASAALAVLR